MAIQQAETQNIIDFAQHISPEQCAEILWRLQQKTIRFRFREYRKDLFLRILKRLAPPTIDF